ncbi:alpha/beta hydrolase [Flavobacterium sp. Sd200]|uniref:alpha/beta hydrolase n=1 Tax=Flavobacterium sp. Sd200 TaxID=2692211 RepID=UPI001369F52F|nr:alpha/beta hydrolase-fold protein [Flavobacterium sp. Sd200]MXN92804.1 alpha/beta hydrolase [Flavobacterium sp. Sd200]
MKFFRLLLFIYLFTTVYAQSQTTDVKPLNIGEVRTLKSAVLNEERTLNIYLPQNYSKEKAYPVIYLLDGTITEDFLHIVGLVQFFTMQLSMPETIVVGIANIDRKRDFTFHTDLKDLKESYPTTGHSDVFIKFIETELLPFIQNNYKTTETKYIIGQSLGGLLATEILLKKPDLFSHYLIVSPSLWWDNESLLKDAKKIVAGQPDTNRYVYISVGKQEHKVMQKDAKELYDVLNSLTRKNLKLDYLPMPLDNHATILHRSIYEAFLKLFPYKE